MTTRTTTSTVTPTRVNRDALIEELSLHVDVGSKAAATRILNFIIDKITDEVVNGNSVAISRFGKFVPFKRSNGDIVPKFRAFSAFKASVAE